MPIQPRKQTDQGNQVCKLVDISSFYTASKLPPDITKADGLEFAVNPIDISRNLSATWADQGGLGTSQNYRQYIRSNRDPIQITGNIIESGSKKYDMQPYLDQFEALIFKGNQSAPKILAIIFSQRIIQPVILTSLAIKETAWTNGFISSGTFDLTFEYIQPFSQINRVTNSPKQTEREKAKQPAKK